MKGTKLISAITSCLLVAGVAHTASYAASDRDQLTLSGADANIETSRVNYIVQLVDPAAASGDIVITPARTSVIDDADYEPNSAAAVAYRQQLANERQC